MILNTEDATKKRLRMVYFILLDAIIMSHRYAYRRDWFEDYLLPLLVIALKKNRIDIQGLERDVDTKIWPELLQMFEEAVNDLEAIRLDGNQGMFTIQPNRAPLLRVLNTAKSCMKRQEIDTIQGMSREVVRMWRNNIKFDDAKRLLGQKPHQKPSA